MNEIRVNDFVDKYTAINIEDGDVFNKCFNGEI